MKDYTKQDLIDHIYHHSDLTKAVLAQASVEALENVITRSNGWEQFYKELPTWRLLRESNKMWNRTLKKAKEANI